MINTARPSPRQLRIQRRDFLSPARANSGLKHEHGEAAAEVGGLFCGHQTTLLFCASFVTVNACEQSPHGFAEVA